MSQLTSLTLEKLSSTGTIDGTLSCDWVMAAPDSAAALVHQALVQELSQLQQGNASAQTRSEVRGGGRKPWKQKGTGRARAGSIRSPLWKGGGVTFGPKPRDFGKSIPRQMRQRALWAALTADPSKVKVVETFAFVSEAKTAVVTGFLKSAGVAQSNVLLISAQGESASLLLASRNVANVTLQTPSLLSIHALLHADVIVISQQALTEIQTRLMPKLSA